MNKNGSQASARVVELAMQFGEAHLNGNEARGGGWASGVGGWGWGSFVAA